MSLHKRSFFFSFFSKYGEPERSDLVLRIKISFLMLELSWKLTYPFKSEMPFYSRKIFLGTRGVYGNSVFSYDRCSIRRPIFLSLQSYIRRL